MYIHLSPFLRKVGYRTGSAAVQRAPLPCSGAGKRPGGRQTSEALSQGATHISLKGRPLNTLGFGGGDHVPRSKIWGWFLVLPSDRGNEDRDPDSISWGSFWASFHLLASALTSFSQHPRDTLGGRNGTGAVRAEPLLQLGLKKNCLHSRSVP